MCEVPPVGNEKQFCSVVLWERTPMFKKKKKDFSTARWEIDGPGE